MPTTYPGFYAGEDVSINGVSLNNLDADGCKWILTDIDGWWGLPEPEVPQDVRPFSDDGDFLTSGRYASRVLTVTGHIVPSAGNVPAVVRARDALNRALNLVRKTAIFQVNETSGPKMAYVQLVGRPLTKFNSINGDLEFNIQLRAADPRKYGVIEQSRHTGLPVPDGGGRTYPKTYSYTYGAGGSTGRLDITNDGSYDTYGIVRITGPVSSPVVEHVESGNSLRFNIVLGIGDYLEVDLQTKTVILNGQASRRNTMLGTSRWFKIAPGTNTLNFTGTQQIAAVDYIPARTNLISNPGLYSSPVGYSVTTIDGANVAYGEGIYGAGAYSSGSGGSFTTAATYSPNFGAIDRGFYHVKYLASAPGGTTNVGYAPISVTPDQQYTGSFYIRTDSGVEGATARISWLNSASTQIRMNLASVPKPLAGTNNWDVETGIDESADEMIRADAGGGPLGSSVFYRGTVVTQKSSGTSCISYTDDSGSVSGLFGDAVVASFYVRFSQATTVIPTLDFRLAGSPSASVTRTPVNVQANTWTRIYVAADAPVEFDGLKISAVLDEYTSLPVDGTYDASMALIETGTSTLHSYFDGDTINTSDTVYSWVDAAGTSVSTATIAVPPQEIAVSDGTYTAMSDGIWYRLSASGTAPSGAISARIVAHLSGADIPTDSAIALDNFLFEKQDTLYEYFDGRSPNASWVGSPDNSPSSVPEVLGVPKADLRFTYRSAWIE